MERAFSPPPLAISGTIRWPRAGRFPSFGLTFALACALGLAIVAGVGWGTVPIAPSLVARVIASHLGLGAITVDWTAAQDAIIWQVRLPRVIGAVLAGAALATSGALFQGLFRNPMADPFVLGISSGAAFGATLALLVGPATGLAAIGILAPTAAGLQAMVVPVTGAIGAVATAFGVFRIARRGSGFLLTDLLLAGFEIGRAHV